MTRSPSLWAGLAVAASLVLSASSAPAQLEVLLRGVAATEPQPGQCGRYRFEAQEPSGRREVVFDACIEAVRGGDTPAVVLHLWAGDSLDARVEVHPKMFDGSGGSLVEHVLAVEHTENGATRRLTAEDWRNLPALSPAPELPVVRDSSLAALKHEATGLRCPGRLLEESRTTQRQMDGSDVVQSESRVLRVWTAPEAPILGVVRAVADVRSERRFSKPIPGVPARGPRQSRYSLELLEFHRDDSNARDKSSR